MSLSSLLTSPIPLLFIFFLIYILYTLLTLDRPLQNFPQAKLKQNRKIIHKFLPSRLLWISQAQALLDSGLAEFPGKCFQVPTLTGYKIIVPRNFADEIAENDSKMDINGFWSRELCISYPGFEAPRILFSSSTFISSLVKNKLTRSLGLVFDDLLDETSCSLHDIWEADPPSSSSSEAEPWHEIPLKPSLQTLISRLTSRIFLGKTLCRDPAWISVSKDYTVCMFIAANQLRIVPETLRPLAHRFLPACKRIREQVATARGLIMPEVRKRVEIAEKALAKGERTSKVADAVGWMVEEVSRRGKGEEGDGEVDYVASQLALTVAAVHTTTETVGRCIVEMGRRGEVVERLREEVLRVLREKGWSNTSLGQMRLVDSFLKEVQRVDALARAPMKRLVVQDVTLSDGTVLPAGSRLMVCDNGRTDSDVYDRPDEFRVDRFLRLREQTSKENEYQFVSTSAEHMTFGYGRHACPGRWFASNEIKILLCFILVRYDFELVGDEAKPWIVDFGDGRYLDPSLKLKVRRRPDSINLLSPKLN